MDELRTGGAVAAVMDFEEMRERVRERLTMMTVCTHDGVLLRRSGARWMGKCPFHTEKSGSFVVGGKHPDRAHCFGCGWDGDIFAYWQQSRGVDFKLALEQLAGLAGVPFNGFTYEAPVKRAPKEREPAERLGGGDGPELPSLPPLRKLREDEVATLAAGRGLDKEGVWVAAHIYKRIGFTPWPLYKSKFDGQWYPKNGGAFPSWIITDSTRRTGEYRRLDNGKYQRADGTEIKAWGTAGKSWPLGVSEIGDRAAVMLVEGGPDVLAAICALRRWRMLKRVAVVGVLGAGVRICEDALPFFKGKRVRIMVDADKPKDAPASDGKRPKNKLPGMEAAARWQEQLTGAGAAVELFSVGPGYHPDDLAKWRAHEMPAAEIRIEYPGLVRADGQDVKDVNDLELAAPEVRESSEVREAFTAWDF